MSTAKVLRRQLLKIPMVRPSYAKYVQHKKHQNADAFLVSFPKSGRTWLRVLLGRVMSEVSGKEFTIELQELATDEIPNVLMTHDDSDLPHKGLEFDKSKYTNKKVVFLARDPRDTVVSYYFQCTKRQDLFTGDLSSFVRHPGFGINRIIDFMNIWARYESESEQFLSMRYEDFHADPVNQLRMLVDFLGISDVEDSVLEDAINYGSFNNMKRMEQTGEVGGLRLTVRDPKDTEAYKVRKGKVGGYTEYFSDEDLEYVNRQVEQNLLSEYGYSARD